MAFFSYSRLSYFAVISTCVLNAWVGPTYRSRSVRNLPLDFIMKSPVLPNTQKYFDKASQNEVQVGGAGGSSSLEGLSRLDRIWHDLKTGGWSIKGTDMVKTHEKTLKEGSETFDVTVIGGTLGIFYAVAMQKKGYKSCVIERGKIAGRPQEWNISKKELNTLVRLGLLEKEDIAKIISIEFNPVRVGFKTDTSPETKDAGFEIYVEDILNLGIKPDILIKMMRDKFIELGGVVYENTALNHIDVYSNVATLSILPPSRAAQPEDGSVSVSVSGSPSSVPDVIHTRLVVDSMGNASPISRQIRGPVEPDGICVVVGSCARGFLAANNTYSDVIYTDTPITVKGSEETPVGLQYFWEAFPAGSSPTDRTTYLFTYMDAKPERPSIMEIMEDYWTLLPRYQGVSPDDLEFIRILYGMFPTYRNSPLSAGFSRILQVGDASGIQSPLSFGGFGSLTRHMERVVGSLSEALDGELLDQSYLSQINPYQPNLSACWMFQRAMSVRVGVQPRAGVVTDTLANTFAGMTKLGDSVLRPFLQDVVQFVPLLRSLLVAFIQDPLTPVKILPHVGLIALLDFTYHMIMMGVYTALASFVAPTLLSIAGTDLSPTAFKLRRKAEAWKFGSGLDYFDH